MVVSRGVDVTPGAWKTQEAKTLERIFQRIDSESCPRLYNFHMHTLCSDGRLSPEALYEQAIELGLKAFAITDHHSLRGYRQAMGWLEDWQWQNPARVKGNRGRPSIARLFTGVEITASLLGVDVHILGYGFQASHDAIAPYLRGHAPQGRARDSQQVIQAIQAAGGIAVLAHPARYRRSPEELIAEATSQGIQGIEAYYAYSNPANWKPCPKQTPRMESLAAHHQLLSTCGTDTHGLNLTRRI